MKSKKYEYARISGLSAITVSEGIESLIFPSNLIGDLNLASNSIMSDFCFSITLIESSTKVFLNESEVDIIIVYVPVASAAPSMIADDLPDLAELNTILYLITLEAESIVWRTFSLLVSTTKITWKSFEVCSFILDINLVNPFWSL